MGLLGKAIKYGSVIAVAHTAGKAYESHKQQHQQPLPQGQYVQPQLQPQQQYRDATGYLHQAWCNGQCHGQCNGYASNAARDIEFDAYPDEKQKGNVLPAY